jgi:hypothetical protein
VPVHPLLSPSAPPTPIFFPRYMLSLYTIPLGSIPCHSKLTAHLQVIEVLVKRTGPGAEVSDDTRNGALTALAAIASKSASARKAVVKHTSWAHVLLGLQDPAACVRRAATKCVCPLLLGDTILLGRHGCHALILESHPTADLSFRSHDRCEFYERRLLRALWPTRCVRCSKMTTLR